MRAKGLVNGGHSISSLNKCIQQFHAFRFRVCEITASVTEICQLSELHEVIAEIFADIISAVKELLLS